MPVPERWRWGRKSVRALGLSLLLSVAIHLGIFGAVTRFFDGASESALEFEVPEAIEFGIVDGDGEPAPAPAPPKAPPEPIRTHPKTRAHEVVAPPQPMLAKESSVALPDAGTLPLDASVAEGQRDAGPSDAAVDRTTHAGPAVASLSGTGFTPGATGDGLGVGAGGHGMGGFAPPGASIGLHVDVPRLRQSSLVLETEALLGVVPAWQNIFAGSGLMPMTDFTRIFVATPNLRPSHLVVSARVAGGRERLNRAAQHLAARAKRPAAWTRQAGVAVIPWYSRGPTPRVLAMVASERLVITRRPDLARVLAVSEALEERAKSGEVLGTDGAPEALLTMYKDEIVALSVEGTHRFVVGEPPGLPRHLRLSVRHIDEFYAGLRVLGAYASPAAASAAEAYAEQVRGRLLQHPQVLYLGLKSALAAATVKREDRFLTFDVRLTMHQTRYLFEYARRRLAN